MSFDPSRDPVLAGLGWDDRLRAHWALVDPLLVPGRVVRADRGQCTVATARGPVRARCGDVAVGDWVGLHPGDRGVVTVLPRSGALERRAPGRETGVLVLAANLDLVFVVHPADRGVNQRRLERELVVAWDASAKPVVLLTKADACGDLGSEVAAAGEVAIGADVVPVSALTGHGMADVRAVLAPGRTVVLVGASGGGKSTLLNALAGEEVQLVQAVRDADGRGRHTTSAGRLVVLPGGALLVDTPGIRAVGLWDAGGLGPAFADIEELAVACRFSDCEHRTEPGCAVRGTIDDDRIASWHKLRREADRTAADRVGWQKAEDNRRLRAFGRRVRAARPRP